jgi:hypothetical protein
MSSKTVGLAVAAVVAGLAGCGGSASSSSPTRSDLPLVRGASVASEVRECDKGTDAFCAVELVVLGHGYGSSADLVKAERDHLKQAGWSGVAPDDGQQRAAASPGQKLRVTYATAAADLLGIDLGWIQRPRRITTRLAQTMFDRSPAMSVLLEAGPD